jgi:hypothetical protein
MSLTKTVIYASTLVLPKRTGVAARRLAHRRSTVTRLPWLAVLVVALCSSYEVLAQETVLLEPVKDNTLIEDPGGALSNGAGPVFFVGRTNQPANSIRRGLLAFDVGEIPEGATVTAVELTLNVVRAAGGGADQPVTLHRVLKDWGVGTSSTDRGRGAPATPGDATWIYDFFDTVEWANPGGDVVEEVSAVQTVGGEGTYAWTSSSDNQMVADVQAWVDDPDQNFGWLIKGNEETGATAKVFASREAVDQAIRPALAVTFEAQAASEPKVITIDAGPDLQWVAQGQAGNPQVEVSAADVLLFRMADTGDSHGLEMFDDGLVRRCDETAVQKPDAVLQEVPTCSSGQSRVGPSFDPLASGAAPEVFAVLIVLKDDAGEVDFRCVVHGFMTGTIL